MSPTDENLSLLSATRLRVFAFGENIARAVRDGSFCW